MLAAVDAGWCTRIRTIQAHGTTSFTFTWAVCMDNHPVSHLATMALTSLTELGLITWHDVGDQELAKPTTRGDQQLRAWDTELGLLAPPDPVSSRPLAGLSTEQLDAEARRLIDAALDTPTPNETDPRDLH
jgi:hypothetical protein